MDFEGIVRSAQKRLLAAAFLITQDRALAEDAVQEAFLRLHKYRDTIRDPKAVTSWLYRTVIRRATDLLREEMRHRNLPDVRLQSLELGDFSEHVVVREALRKALAELSPEQRGVAALYYLEDWDVDQIARALEIPSGTVKSRLYHARQRLRHTLDMGSTSNSEGVTKS